MSLLRKQVESVASWLIKQLLDRWGLVVLTFAGVILLPLFKTGRDLLVARYLVPGWLLAGCAWLVLLLAAVVVVHQVQVWQRQRRQRQLTRFESCGFRWRLTSNFWATYRTFRADEMGITGTLLGPLCLQCETDVSDDLLAARGTCGNCEHPLTPTVPIQAENRPGIVSQNNSDPLWPLRKATYRDAQAKALKGELRQF